jgi:3-oxoacyl-[acyl-carrier protein] reductase
MSTNDCIVISGCSRGFGLVLAETLLKSGHAVAGFARTKTPSIEQLASGHGAKLHFEELDGTAYGSVERFIDGSLEKFGGIHALINNAAIGQDHLLSHISVDNIQRIIEVNLTSVILLTRLVIKKMLLTGHGGHIVNISSICGQKGFPGLSVYSAAKGALDAFTRSLAVEVGERNILVNAVAPGFFSSEMSSVLSEEQTRAISSRTPTRRLSTPKDILPLVELLLFKNTNMTGQVLAIDGGASV